MTTFRMIPHRRWYRWHTVAVVVLTLIVGCEDPPPPTPIDPHHHGGSGPMAGDRSTPATAIRTGPFPVTVRSGDSVLNIPIPAGWEEIPLTPFQKEIGGIHHRLRVPIAGQSVETTVSTLDGGLRRSIDRWATGYPNQKPEIENIDLASGGNAVWVRYRDRFAGDRLEREGMIGIAIPFDRDRAVYLKFRGRDILLTDFATKLREVISQTERSTSEPTTDQPQAPDSDE